MFGFLAPSTRIPAWRRSYARVCQYQRKYFGLKSLPFLSYEATFLYQIASELGVIDCVSEDAPTCCRLRRLPAADGTLPDDEVGKFCAAFGVVLAGVKLDDDVRDSGRLLNRVLRHTMKRKVANARRVLATGSATLLDQLQDSITRHLELERNSTSLRLDDYVKPTGDGFAAVFSALPVQSHFAGRDDLEQIGRAIGHAIISWDCAVDFEKDQITGHFNPLSERTEVSAAFDLCLLQLANIGWMLPTDSISRQVIASVADRVRCRKLAAKTPRIEPVRLLERWGLIRQKGYTYARCDGCEVACMLTECCEGGAEAATCCAGPDIGGVCCCCDVLPWECCVTEDKKKANQPSSESARQKSPYDQYIGQVAMTDQALNPTGFVHIDGERIPAKLESGSFLPVDVAVAICGADGFGVIVRPFAGYRPN